jgi:predicted Zn-dependent protease
VALLRAKEPTRAAVELAPLLKSTPHPMLFGLAAGIKRASGDDKGAVAVLKQALASYPNNRALNYACIEALQQLGQNHDASLLLDEQLRNYPRDAKLYALQAKGYAFLGKRLLQHQAQAEAYVLQGSLPAAIEQLQLAQKSGDGDFYQLSSVDARLRDLRQKLAQEMKEKKESK